MQSLLLKNARDIQIDPVKREESRRKIKEAVYYERTLYTKNEFFRLVWMKADNILGSNLYKRLTPENEPRTLENLVKRIRDQYDYDDYDSPHKIFEALNRELSTLQEVPYEDYVYGTNTSMNKKWFTGCIAINGTFDPRLIRELWVSELQEGESQQSPDGMYYIADGCHRALVYAINLDFDLVEYIPIKVRWCKSWSHIYPW